MDWLQTAVVVMALASGVLAMTFLYVWHSFIRRPYVLLWSLAWLVAIPHLVFVLRTLVAEPRYADVALSQLTLAINALLMLGGCFAFVHGRLPDRRAFLAATPFLAWAAIGPALELPTLVTAPASLLLGASYLWASGLFVRLHRERGTRGARMVAVLFFIAGLHEFDYPLLGHLPGFAPIGYTAAATLALAISLGLLITVLEEARADAVRERTRVQAIIDSLPVGVLVAGEEGEIQLTNAAVRAQLALERLEPGTPVAELEADALGTTSENAEPHSPDAPIGHALARGEAVAPHERRIRTADGEQTLLVSAAPIRDATRRLGAVAVFEDITELKRMQSRVTRARRLEGLGTLAAGVAHDFNNALTMILGHAEVAADAAGEPAVRHQLDVIRNVAADGAAIVRRIQDVARTRVNREQVRFDLSAVAREVVDVARPRWRDQAQAASLDYRVRTELAHELPVSGEPSEMREALLNLVLNALDAMPEGGDLLLETRRAEDAALLIVRDSGVGMSDEVRERVFDPFFSTKGKRGTGLGLSVVYSIIQRHEGEISVASTPGRGTTFQVRLPLTRSEARDPQPQSVADTGRYRILAVDDEELVRDLTQTLLTAAGHQTHAAADGEEALRIAAREELDLVLTDLGMPGLNGWQVTHELRRRDADLPIVLVTGWGDNVTLEEARSKGVTAVLAKPFTKAQLLACVSATARRNATVLV